TLIAGTLEPPREANQRMEDGFLEWWEDGQWHNAKEIAERWTMGRELTFRGTKRGTAGTMKRKGERERGRQGRCRSTQVDDGAVWWYDGDDGRWNRETKGKKTAEQRDVKARKEGERGDERCTSTTFEAVCGTTGDDGRSKNVLVSDSLRYDEEDGRANNLRFRVLWGTTGTLVRRWDPPKGKLGGTLEGPITIVCVKWNEGND
ncbi:hypothetical protein BKA70DRAFT_1224890, partial [Coprinopsis sp. MPI-PUGE-AT-0042]